MTMSIVMYSEANASDLLQHIEELFPRYYMQDYGYKVRNFCRFATERFLRNYAISIFCNNNHICLRSNIQCISVDLLEIQAYQHRFAQANGGSTNTSCMM